MAKAVFHLINGQVATVNNVDYNETLDRMADDCNKVIIKGHMRSTVVCWKNVMVVEVINDD